MRLFAPLAALLLASSALAAAPTTLKIVVDGGSEEHSVNITFPLGLAETALALAPVERSAGRIRVGDRDLKVSELRKLWSEVQRSGDADLVTVQDGGERVRVSTKGGTVLVRVEQKGASRVRVELPHAVVDALLSGRGEDLDFAAAIRRLRDLEPGEIIRVQDGEETVRISIE